LLRQETADLRYLLFAPSKGAGFRQTDTGPLTSILTIFIVFEF